VSSRVPYVSAGRASEVFSCYPDCTYVSVVPASCLFCALILGSGRVCTLLSKVQSRIYFPWYNQHVDKPAATIGSEALLPNPALKPFEVLVGKWKTVGSHGLLPGVTLHGNVSFEWIENGAYLFMRSEIIDDSRFPSGIAIFGSDDVQKRFFMLYFDQRGVSRMFEVSIENKTIKWRRDQPGFSQRTANILSSDGKTIISKGELSKDGTNWEKDLELTYTRSQ